MTCPTSGGFFCRFLKSSIGKKQVIAVTGLMLCGFLMVHLIGNTLMLVSAEAFNRYSHALISNPLIYVAETVLTLIFVTHIALAIKITLENKAARPVGYYVKKTTGKGASFASSTMPYTGLITLVFLVTHILGIKFGPHYSAVYNNVEMRDLYKLLSEVFKNPLMVTWYVVASISLGIHVSHGLWSVFQTFGVNHPKYNCTIKFISRAYGCLVVVGYSIFPIYCYFN